jgi:hypothetical protein
MHVNAAVPVKLEGQFSPPQEDFEMLSLNKPLLNETEDGALTLQQTVDDANDRYCNRIILCWIPVERSFHSTTSFKKSCCRSIP